MLIKNIKQIIKSFLLLVVCVSLALVVNLSIVKSAEPKAGAVNNWFNVSSASYLSVDMKPTYGEEGYHYYSLSPFFEGQSYGLYSGIQTNGNVAGHEVGNMFIFSVWNATVAFPENGAIATPFSGEGIGYSLRKAYDWKVGDTYNITIKRESFDSTNNGYRWSATLKHKESGEVLKLGEITAPSGANFMKSGSLFHERYSGTIPVCSPTESNLEKAGVTFSNLSSDKSVSISGAPANNNIFASVACDPYIHTTSASGVVSTGFGMTSAEFTNGPISTTPPATSPSQPTTQTPTPQPTTNQPAIPTETPSSPGPVTPEQDIKPIVPIVTTDADEITVIPRLINESKKYITSKVIWITGISLAAIYTAVIITIIIAQRNAKKRNKTIPAKIDLNTQTIPEPRNNFLQ